MDDPTVTISKVRDLHPDSTQRQPFSINTTLRKTTQKSQGINTHQDFQKHGLGDEVNKNKKISSSLYSWPIDVADP